MVSEDEPLTKLKMLFTNKLVPVTSLYLIGLMTEEVECGSDQTLMNAINYLPIVSRTGANSNNTIVVQPTTTSSSTGLSFVIIHSK